MRLNDLERYKILVADDDKNTVAKIKEILEENGCENVTGKSRISALRELENYELVILDIIWRGNAKPKHQINDYFGVSAAKYLREVSPSCRVILMSKFFYELDQLKEISEVCDDFFSSNGDATEIFRKIMKVASVSESYAREELLSRAVLLVKEILQEVDGQVENKPSLVGINNKVHADLLREIEVIEAQGGKNALLLKKAIDNLSISLIECTGTISKPLLELLQEIKLMASDRKVEMNFNAPVTSAAGNVERDLVVNHFSKTPEQAAEEIQNLLSYLRHSNTTDLKNALQQEIIRNPTFKSRLRNALKEAGLETAKVIFAPLGIGIEAVRGWVEAE